MTAEITGGTVENPRLVGTGQTDVAICNANHGFSAFKGEDPYDKKYDVRAIGSLHSSVLHIVTIDGTGVKTIPDLKGQRVAVGPAGGPAPMLKAVFSVHENLKFEDIRPSFVSFSDGVTNLKDGNVKAALVLAGYPAAAILELAVTNKVRFVEIAEDKISEIQKKHPYYARMVLPASVYKTDNDPVVLGVRNLLVVSPKMDEDTAYKITKAVYSHLDELIKYHDSLKRVSLKEVADVGGVPLHPGALKYLKEAGLVK
jgi:TRAP transporter TAXI family solute receptor